MAAVACAVTSRVVGSWVTPTTMVDLDEARGVLPGLGVPEQAMTASTAARAAASRIDLMRPMMLVVLQRRREASVYSGPASVHEEAGARDEAGGIRDQEDDSSRDLRRLRPAPNRALLRVSAIPLGIVFDLACERGLGNPGGHRVDADTPVTQLGSQRAGQEHDAGFGGCVDRLARLDHAAANAGHHDDAAPATLGHATAELPHDAKGALEVDVHDASEGVVIDVEQRPADVDARGDHQGVGRFDTRPGGLHAGWGGNVQLERFRAPSLAADRFGGLCRTFYIQVRADRVSPEGGEGVSAGLADAAGRPDDESDPAVEVEQVSVLVHPRQA